MAELLHFPAPAREPVSSSQPPDHEARIRALDIRLSCIVEAPAGSGKTGLLLQRYLKLLAEGGVAQPEEVLAITFTRKAIAELRKRVLDQLQAAASSTPLPPDAGSFDRETRALAEAVLAVDARLHWCLLDQPQCLRIRTIDAVCGEIARTLPLLSGSGASNPVDDAKPLYNEAARRTLLQLGGADAELNAALRTVLLHRDGNLADCELLLARMLGQRDQWAEFVPLDATTLTEDFLENHVRPRLERSLESIVCTGLNRALNSLSPALLAELTSLAARLGLQPGYNGSGSPISICADRQQPPAARAEDLEHWLALIHILFTKDGEWRKSFAVNTLRFETSKADKAHLRQLLDQISSEHDGESLRALRNLPSPRYPDDQWHVAKALFRLLRHALAQLKVLFSETGQCDFTEISLAARVALSSQDEPTAATDLASSPAARLTHLLVDEMQDTSSSQYTLLELLTRSWDGRSQTLFLVGDPKQSIYLFRQARVERFLRTVRERRLGDIPLEVLQLTANFRSQATLVERFNDTFAQLFPAATNSSDIPDIPFVPSEPARAEPTHPRASSSAITWHASILGDDLAPDTAPPSAAELRAARARNEARTIRRIIEDWKARPLPSGRARSWQIAVLARARHHLAPVVAELKRDYGPARGPIAYSAVEIDSLAERPEVLDVLALTRALLHLADRTAWLAVLHAPWCGLSLADLLTLTGEGEHADATATLAELVAMRRHQLSPTGQRLLDRTWPVLEAAVNTLGRTALSVHVERTWLSLGGDAPLPSAHRENVHRFLEILRNLEAEAGRVDFSVLAARLADLYASSPESDVKLLTIHKSKGLEFDVVLVPGLERRANRSASDLLNWLELDSPGNDAAHILLAPIWSRGEDSDRLNQWLRRIKLAREHAEVKRLAYVASTRAQEELHLFAASQRNQNQSLRQPAAGTLLHAFWPAAGPYFSATAVQPASDLAAALRNSLTEDSAASYDDTDQGLALAAAADSSETAPHQTASPPQQQPPLLHRFPLSFNPLARFTAAESTRLAYTPASALPHAAAFERPEGSFAVRAFGNVVHRFLQILSTHLDRHNDPDALLAELPSWQPRLLASLRGEGLPPSQLRREAARALTALRNALTDPIGRWILSPHLGAANERSLASSSAVFRADRSFLAGAAPLSFAEDCIWIVDFKTTEQGSRAPDLFARDEIAKYRVQLQRYATIRRALPGGDKPIYLGLFYPLLPRLLYWSSDEPLVS